MVYNFRNFEEIGFFLERFLEPAKSNVRALFYTTSEAGLSEWATFKTSTNYFDLLFVIHSWQLL